MNKSAPGSLPVFKFHTTIRNDELLPMPHDHSLKHHEFMFELEKWSLFGSLPNIMTMNDGL